MGLVIDICISRIERCGWSVVYLYYLFIYLLGIIHQLLRDMIYICEG